MLAGIDLPSTLFAGFTPLEAGKFGQYYEIRGTLSHPKGVTLAVRTIWMTEHLSGITKFVTLIPDKRRT